EVETLLRQKVFVALRSFLVGDAPQHAVAHQLLQAVGEDMPGDAEPRLKFLEAPHAQEAVAEHQQRPAVADHRHRARDRALLFFQRTPFHPAVPRWRATKYYFRTDCARNLVVIVMAGPAQGRVPAIRALVAQKIVVDARDKPAHDDFGGKIRLDSTKKELY